MIAAVSSRNVDAARALGADEVIDHTNTRFEDAIEPVDLVFDTAGGDPLQRSPAVLREGGRLVSVAEETPTGRAALYFVVEPNREQLLEISERIDAAGLARRSTRSSTRRRARGVRAQPGARHPRQGRPARSPARRDEHVG